MTIVGIAAFFWLLAHGHIQLALALAFIGLILEVGR